MLSADVATALAAAVDAEVTGGEHLDLGWDRPVTMRQVAALSAVQLGRPVRVRHLRWGLLNTALRLVGPLDARVEDSRARFTFLQTGRFVADTSRQAEVLGLVPTADRPAASPGTRPLLSTGTTP